VSIPQRTIDHLTNWMDRYIGDFNKSKSYREYCEQCAFPVNQVSTPIPCPNCYYLKGKFVDELKPIGKIFEIGVYGFKCNCCKLRFPELIALSMETFVDLIRSGQANNLIDQTVYDDLWIVEGEDYVIKLTENKIKNFISVSRFEL